VLRFRGREPEKIRTVAKIVRHTMEERLQKLIARAGISSRRHAEELILSGQVRVNGKVVTELGTKADPAKDRIEAAGRLVVAEERKVYLLLHKPPQIVSTMADPEGRPTLRHYLRGLPERVYPVGRLEFDASGLVFLTNDGDLAAEMLRLWSHLPQTYYIKVKGRLSEMQVKQIAAETSALLKPIRQPGATRGHTANFWYEVTLRDSRRDRLRRALLIQQHPAEKLKRVALGPLTLEGVPLGRYRSLTPTEVDRLQRALKAGAVVKPPKKKRPRKESKAHKETVIVA
jgi:23S rRNA pseudouridine2605 synthase